MYSPVIGSKLAASQVLMKSSEYVIVLFLVGCYIVNIGALVSAVKHYYLVKSLMKATCILY